MNEMLLLEEPQSFSFHVCASLILQQCEFNLSVLIWDAQSLTPTI